MIELKRSVLLLTVLMGLAIISAPTVANGDQWGGLDVVISPNGDGTGSFTITGDNEYGIVDLSGTWSVQFDSETRTMTILITVTGTIVTADGEVIEVDRDFTFSGNANVRGAIRSIMEWVQQLLEN